MRLKSFLTYAWEICEICVLQPWWISFVIRFSFPSKPIGDVYLENYYVNDNNTTFDDSVLILLRLWHNEQEIQILLKVL